MDAAGPDGSHGAAHEEGVTVLQESDVSGRAVEEGRVVLLCLARAQPGSEHSAHDTETLSVLMSMDVGSAAKSFRLEAAHKAPKPHSVNVGFEARLTKSWACP